MRFHRPRSPPDVIVHANDQSHTHALRRVIRLQGQIRTHQRLVSQPDESTNRVTDTDDATLQRLWLHRPQPRVIASELRNRSLASAYRTSRRSAP